jgi:hypothetical protein
MNVIRVFAIVAACVASLACGPASADVGNPLAAGSDGYPAPPNTLPMPKAPSLVPTIQPAPSVNPRDLKSHRAAKPHAAKPICYGAHPVRAGSAVRGKTATGVVPNFIRMDGNTGRFTTNLRMPPPQHGVPVGTNSDPGPAGQGLRQAVKFRRAARPHAAKPGCYGMHPARAGWGDKARTASGIPPNCLTVDGNTGRCITNGKMPPAPRGVPVGTTSDPGP